MPWSRSTAIRTSRWATCCEGVADFYIGDQHRRVGPGDIWRIPGGTPHRVVALDQPVRAIDVFYPIRDDYK